jgi:hypothetical protein
MPARDIYHNSVKNALIKDGWTITHDPYTLTFGLRDVFVDIGAERMLALSKRMPNTNQHVVMWRFTK